MTVEKIGRDGEVQAVYFGKNADGAWKFERQTFAPVLIEKTGWSDEALARARVAVEKLSASKPSVRDDHHWNDLLIHAVIGALDNGR